MARKNVPANDSIDPIEEPTPEQIAEWEDEREEERERQLAPYRAFAQQQAEQDELIADLLFRETMRELEE